MPSRGVHGHASLGNILDFFSSLKYPFGSPVSQTDKAVGDFVTRPAATQASFRGFPSNSENLIDFRKTMETGMDPRLLNCFLKS